MTDWTWNAFRKCWEAGARRAYPGEDGAFSISEHECWIPGVYADFDAALVAFEVDDGTLISLRDAITVGTGAPVTVAHLRAHHA